MHYMRHPGVKIKEWMEARGWSENELARRCGVRQPTIHRIITQASRSPKRETIERIVRAFGRTAEDAYDVKITNEVRERGAAVYGVLEGLTDDQRDLVLQIVEQFRRAR